MQAPNNIYDAGWYTGSSKPGQNGAMVVDGHASQTGTHYGLFGRLESLADGDKITVEKGDGTKLSFTVAKVEVVAIKDVDMNQVMVPYNSSTQGLNLITCAGDWTKDGKTLDHRVIVFAVPAA
jgi:LPXTG-site transpeptidase (sortase) family protein